MNFFVHRLIEDNILNNNKETINSIYKYVTIKLNNIENEIFELVHYGNFTVTDIESLSPIRRESYYQRLIDVFENQKKANEANSGANSNIKRTEI